MITKVKTVKDLREFIADLPDEMKLELWWVDPTMETHTRNITVETGSNAIGIDILSIIGVEKYV